ncbi:DUF5133 domain-containing protein [Streptomyces sp. NBC_01794]|uniref:DUF5133 domain-containing protein n=1 Tax=Streptomyces sp. NBC_01794 TaxID=2975942 RepID=UPI00308B13AC|nr:DUF5133 domain-containing protein [Streptomyces sp. NBC_01794]
MLMPDAGVIAGLMARYRAQERLVLVAPHDPRARSRFEDTAYTLCVLMGERTAAEAVIAAERYIAQTRPNHRPVQRQTAPRRC